MFCMRVKSAMLGDTGLWGCWGVGVGVGGFCFEGRFVDIGLLCYTYMCNDSNTVMVLFLSFSVADCL